MNVLIVDDEIYCAEGVRHSVDWESLGVQNVYLSHSMKQAQSFFMKKDIHIVLCDIEMPRGSGLELLGWVKEKNYSVEIILLTSYKTFQYAKRGIELGVLDYLLKPVPQEKLHSVLRDAISRIEQKSSIEERLQQAKNWNKAERQLIHDFWKDMINEEIPKNEEKVLMHMERRQISLNPSVLSFPILFKSFEMKNDSIMKKFIFFIMDDLREAGLFDPNPVILVHNEKKVLLIIENDGLLNKSNDYVRRWCEEFIQKCRKNYNISIGCYIGRFCHSDELIQQYINLYNRDVNNVVELADIFFDDRLNRELKYFSPEIRKWKELLENGNYNSFCEAVIEALDKLISEKRINSYILKRFIEDVETLLNESLSFQGLSLGSLTDDGVEDSFSMSIKTVKEFKIWIKSIIGRLAESINNSSSSISLLDKILAFVDEHYREDISREQIADFVYVSPDYLSRYFKKKMGLSLSKYITKKRLDEAKRLLVETEMYAGEVGFSVGYNDVSYFTKVFHSAFKETPMHYRTRFQNNKW